MKFSDIKKHPYLTYRWDRATSFLDNCAHYPDMHNEVMLYLEKLRVQMIRRPSLKRHADKHPPKSYIDVMKLSYLPEHKTKIVISTPETRTWIDTLAEGWDSLKVELLTFDGQIDSIGKSVRSITEMMRIVGFKFEEEGLDLYDPNFNHMDPMYTLEHHLYLTNDMPPTLDQFKFLARKVPFSDFMHLDEFWEKKHTFSHTTETKLELISKVGVLLTIYSLVAVSENLLEKMPIIGPVYKLFTNLEVITADAYSKANALFYMLYGDSSKVLSSLIPKDHYKHLKVIALKLFGRLSWIDHPQFPVDPSSLRSLIESMIVTIANLNELVIKTNIQPLICSGEVLPQPGLSGWVALDHDMEVENCMKILSEGQTPLVTAPVGAGKSTDFIIGLKAKYKTVHLCLPRRVQVMNNPIVNTRCYQGSTESPKPGRINCGTHGYYRQFLSKLEDDEILVLDEFHELDENSLWLYNQFKGRVILVTATPDFGVKLLEAVEVKLKANRVSSFRVKETLRTKPLSFEQSVLDILKTEKQTKVLVIHPSKKVCERLLEASNRYFKGMNAQTLSRENPHVLDNQWYFATQIADSGITIPGLQLVIDSGLTGSFTDNEWGIRDSSKPTYIQRKGRTGRTCDGRYIRLNNRFNKVKPSFSWPFIINYPKLAVAFGANYTGEMKPKISNQFIPWPLQNRLDQKLETTNVGISSLFLGISLYETRGDLVKAKDIYLQAQKFGPESVYPLYRDYENYRLIDYELALRKFNSISDNWINLETHRLESKEFSHLPIKTWKPPRSLGLR